MTAARNTDFLAAAAAIAELGRDLYGLGWLPATSGNLSVRLDAASCAVTVSGRDKGRLTGQDVMRVSLAGDPLGPGQPSAETLLHTGLYRWSADIGAVLHTHGPATTILGLRLAGRDRLVLEGYELLKAFAGVATHATRLDFPIFDNTQDIATLAEDVMDRLDGHSPPCQGYLIRGHGTYVWGRDLGEARRHLEALEYLANCELALDRPGASHP